VQLDGCAGPQPRSKAILDRLKASGAETNIFDLHLALEEAIVGSPLTAGNKVLLLQDARYLPGDDRRDRCSAAINAEPTSSRTTLSASVSPPR
jgi:cardiolipin synthase